MTNLSNPGSDSQLMTTFKNAINSPAYSKDELKLAAVAVALINETFPVQQKVSDEAAQLRLELMAEIAAEVGEQRFVQAVRNAIKISHRRWDVSIARIREMAGLRFMPEPSPAAQAWELITRVFIDHCRSDADGNYRLEEKVTIVDGKACVTPVPEIPPAAKRAIQCLGGWAALAESWPEFWQAKLKDFRELYHEADVSPRMDRPASSLERVK